MQESIGYLPKITLYSRHFFFMFLIQIYSQSISFVSRGAVLFALVLTQCTFMQLYSYFCPYVPIQTFISQSQNSPLPNENIGQWFRHVLSSYNSVLFTRLSCVTSHLLIGIQGNNPSNICLLPTFPKVSLFSFL